MKGGHLSGSGGLVDVLYDGSASDLDMLFIVNPNYF